MALLEKGQNVKVVKGIHTGRTGRFVRYGFSPMGNTFKKVFPELGSTVMVELDNPESYILVDESCVEPINPEESERMGA